MHNAGTNIAIPQEQKITLVLDACAISQMASVKRKRGGSWLDLIKHTAQLPTINFIIIPAIIADWELRGGATIVNADGQLEFIRVDKDFADPTNRKGKNDKAFAELLSTASQYRHDGYDYKVTLGSNPKILIVETDMQRKLLLRLAAISRIENEQEKHEQISIFRRKRDTGERMMEHIAINAPLTNPVFLVSNDINYFTARDRSNVTVAGYPIGTAKVLDYIHAELNVRPKTIKAELGITSVDEYREGAVKAGLFSELGLTHYPDGYKNTGPGLYLSGENQVKGESLSDAFERGAMALEGNLPAYNFLPPTPPASEPVISPLISLATMFAERLREKAEWIKSVLFEYQVPMSDAVADDLAAGNTGGTMKEPTGSGKTVVMGAVIKALDARSLVLAPKRTIANNTAKEFAERLGISLDDIGVYHTGVSRQKREKALDKKILITTSMSAVSLCRRGLINRGDFQYIALDEAHKMRGDVTAGTIKEVLVPDSIIHAWTATDKFFDGSLVGETLFGRRAHIHSTTIKQAINQGWLPDTINLIIKTHVDYTEVPANHELSEKQQRALASRAGRDEQALAMSYSYVHPDTGIVFSEQQSIWFCAGIKHAERVAKKLNELHGEGYARAISGKSKNQEEILADHKAGKFKAIVNADLLIEGWNNQRCSICYMLRDTLSPIITEQAGGRVERLDPTNPDKISFVINLVDEGRPHSLVFADVAEGWLLKSNKGILDRSPMRQPEYNKILPPEYPSLESLDIVETEREFVEFFSQRDEARKALIAPEKTDEWLTRTDVMRYLGASYQSNELVSLLGEIESKYGSQGRFEIDGQELLLGYRSIYKLTPFCFHITVADIIAKHLKLDIEEKTPVWKNKTEMAKELGIASYRGGYERLWAVLEEEYDKTGKAQVNGVEIACGRKKTADHTRWKQFCVHESELEKIREGIGLKTDEWLAQHDMEKALGASRKNADYVALWQDLRTQYQSNGVAKIGDREIKCGIKGNDNNPAFCVHDSEVPFIKSHLKLDIPKKTDDWINLRQAGKVLRTNPTNSPLSKLWQRMDSELRTVGKTLINGVEVRAQIMQASSNRIMCIHKDDMELLRKELGLAVEEKTPEWLHKTDIMKSLGVTGNDTKMELLKELWEALEKQFTATGKGVVDSQELRLEVRKVANHILMCVHADSMVHIRKYLGRDLEEKTEGWLSKAEFMNALHVTGGKDSFFAKLFDRIKIAYDAGEKFHINGFEIEYGYKVSATITAFFVHHDCLPHVKKEYKLDLFDKGGEWHASFEYAKLLGTYHIDKAFQKLWSSLESVSAADKTPEINGSQIKCGHKRVGENLRFYVNTEHVDVLRQKLESIKSETKAGSIKRIKTNNETWVGFVDKSERGRFKA